jgi:hypothetical protein
MTNSGTVDYSFTEKEVRSLALLLRKQEGVLDSSLDDLKDFLEGHLYRIMTIEEAETFFDEK